LADSDDLYVKQRGLAQESAFWGSQCFQKLPKGSFSPTPQKIRQGIGISTLNKTINNFLTVHAIFAQISSIGAARRHKFKIFNELTEISS
jgi:hypothetical protein